MYSVVLLMAMTTGGEAQNGMFSKGDNGCSCSCSCTAPSNGGHKHHKKKEKDCCGCCGCTCCGCCGCSGCSCGCSGCNCGCCGCTGYSCHGCCGCCGCAGYSCSGCCGCSGCSGWSCSGCSGCCGCAAPVYSAPAYPAHPIAPVVPVKPGEPIGKPVGQAAAPATIIVSLPADAKLFIDGAATTSTAARRVFVSPELNPGKEFHYTLKAEFAREGKPVTETKRVAVTAGNETNVLFDAAAPSVAAR